MFTGIIEELGKVRDIKSNKIIIECVKVLDSARLGDSIAVNGVCLTICELLKNGFVADISQETLKVTNIGSLNSNDSVNLERAMSIGSRFGGHIVSGHIDGVGICSSILKKNEFYEFRIKLSSELIKYVVKKGSITVNGISLTVANIEDNIITIAIIPHTYENTNLKFLQKNDSLNIEVDMIAKYVEKFLLTSDNKSSISLEFLREHGF